MTKKELLARIDELERKNAFLENDCRIKSDTIDMMKALPKGCQYGGYCAGCIYGETTFDVFTRKTTFCTYGACKNFAPREG